MRELTVDEVNSVSGGDDSVASDFWDWLTGSGTPTPLGMAQAGGACVVAFGAGMALAPESGGLSFAGAAIIGAGCAAAAYDTGYAAGAITRAAAAAA